MQQRDHQPGSKGPALVTPTGQLLSRTGSTSGSATPRTSYGSFPVKGGAVAPADMDARLQAAAKKGKGRADQSSSDGSSSPISNPAKGRTASPYRSWSKSSEALTRRLENLHDPDADLPEDSSPALSSTSEDRPILRRSVSDYTSRHALSPSLQEQGIHGRIPLKRRRSGIITTSDEDKQYGVLKMELMARHWGKKGLLVVYAGVYLISTLTSLEGNTSPTVEPYFLSLLGSHSLLSSVAIVQNIAYAVGKPPMAKILDVFGRAEGVTIAALLYSLGYIMTALSPNVKVYIAARAIASIGGQGLQLSQQIIVADTSTLTNRGLITSTISLPWLVTTWVGPVLGGWFQSKGEVGYRASYFTFGVLLPFVALVLVGNLWVQWRRVHINQKQHSFRTAVRHRRLSSSAPRRPHRMSSEVSDAARSLMSEENAHLHSRNNSSDESDTEWLAKHASDPLRSQVSTEFIGQEIAGEKWRKRGCLSLAAEVWRDLDIVGTLSLMVGCAMLLIPFTLAARTPEHWLSPEIWLMVCIGLVILVFFGVYEFNFSPLPMLPPRLLKNRTILAGSALGFWHFLSQFCYESYFTSFLQVARSHSPRDASYISQSYIFAASVAAIVAGLLAKYLRRYRSIGIAGVLIHMCGTLLMTRTRNLNSSTAELVLSQLIGGIGGGFTTIAVQIGVQSVVSHQDVSVATAIFLTITQIGGAVGGAVAGGVWTTLLPRSLYAYLPESNHDLIPEIMASLSYAISFPQGEPIRQAIDMAYTDTQRVLNYMAVAMLFPALLCICLMHNTKLDAEDQGQGDQVVVLGTATRPTSMVVPDEGGLETTSLLGPGEVSDRSA